MPTYAEIISRQVKSFISPTSSDAASDASTSPPNITATSLALSTLSLKKHNLTPDQQIAILTQALSSQNEELATQNMQIQLLTQKLSNMEDRFSAENQQLHEAVSILQEQLAISEMDGGLFLRVSRQVLSVLEKFGGRSRLGLPATDREFVKTVVEDAEMTLNERMERKRGGPKGGIKSGQCWEDIEGKMVGAKGGNKPGQTFEGLEGLR
ncbi:hypothetical protein EG329_009930 [Mollisiaceae sp. DMI_Dod_QoI]|nr:hypothetical protein EG329_009930 [Helotiales sp. DMI_Dod_QoI]